MELKRFFYNWLQINIFKVHEAPFVKKICFADSPSDALTISLKKMFSFHDFCIYKPQSLHLPYQMIVYF